MVWGRSENVTDDTAEMNADRESDGSIVPAKPTNKSAAEAPAESVEERDPTKRNAPQANPPRTQRRANDGSSGLERVREAERGGRHQQPPRSPNSDLHARLKVGAV